MSQPIIKEIKRHRDTITNIKKMVNCILENGAYSNKNEKRQLAVGSNNYNPAEKILVQTSWKFRKYHGIMMQKALKEFFEKEPDFLNYLKQEDEELFQLLKDMEV